RQKSEGWGTKVIPRLSRDIRNELPAVKGFSERNIGYMIRFAREYPEGSPILQRPVAKLPEQTAQGSQAVAQSLASEKVTQPAAQMDSGEILQQTVAKLPWGHHISLMEKVKDLPTRYWYMTAVIEQGWSRDVLTAMIKSNAYERQGAAVTNFESHLPAPQSNLAREVLKDPYIFDFLTLRCFIVIDLKRGPFKPEYVGKMNFYCSVVDERLRHADDLPTIGLILCQDKKKVIAEYTLRKVNTPIGVSEYELTRALPSRFRSALPTISKIEKELSE
ncbi:MAG: PDDEXK nuclease domain-containing protein, partial [Verrucomicrobiota bacterium]